jgi:hypothetical protein
VILFDFDANISCFTFDQEFAANGVLGGRRLLMLNEDKTTCMIDIDCTACITVARATVTGISSDSTNYWGNVMITADAVAWLQIGTRSSVLSTFNLRF